MLRLLLDWEGAWAWSWAWTQSTTTDTTTTTTDTTTNQTPATSSDKGIDSATVRYKNMQERIKQEKLEKELNSYKEKESKAPQEFTKENDPDGTKELDYRVEERASKILKETLEKLWLEDKIEEIHQTKRMDDFFKSVESEFPAFEKFGIKPTRDELQKALLSLDKDGITPLQLIWLAKLPELMNLIKPPSMVPGDWWRTNGQDRVRTQEEINAEIYKANWVFGY